MREGGRGGGVWGMLGNEWGMWGGLGDLALALERAAVLLVWKS